MNEMKSQAKIKDVLLNRFIEELLDLVRQEEDVLKRYLDLLYLQKQYLLAEKIELFQKTVQQQEVLIVNIKLYEEKRIAKVVEIADSKGMNEDEITLTHIIEMTLGDVSSDLKNVKKSLSGLVERIYRANRINELLIKRSLDYIQHNIGWMIDAADNTQVYDPSGRTSRQSGTSVIVNKVM